MNRFDEMRHAVAEAEQTLRAADEVADRMGRLLRGRLKRVSPSVLVQLKAELTHFNAKTKEWS